MLLWSLLKIVIFIGIIAAAAWGAGFLLETDGGVRMAVAGTEFTLGPLESVIALMVLLVVGWLIFRLVGLIIAFLRWAVLGEDIGPSRYFGRRRERKGYDALADGMMALASGEGRLALAKAETADKYLRRPHLTNLLTAQAAELAGDKAKAEETYRKLLADDRTRFVGVRGILKQKLEEGDTDTALKLAEKAFAIKPRHEETQNTLLQLQAEQGDWTGARKTLGAKLKHGHLPRDVHKRRDAVLALSQARDGSEADMDKAIEANRLSPDLVPAAVLAARGQIAQGKNRVATRTIKKAWEASPHPELASAFAEIEPNESPTERVKRFSVLTGIHPGHPETKMLNAELNIAAEDFPAARKAIGDLPETDPTARSLTIMAAIERGAGADDAVVKGWLARALTAPRDPQWICEDCSTAHAEWHPVCSNCSHFDTLSWKRPSATSSQMASGTEMLPLIVGSIEDQSNDEETEAEPEGDVIDDVVMTDPVTGSDLDEEHSELVDLTPSDAVEEDTATEPEKERI